MQSIGPTVQRFLAPRYQLYFQQNQLDDFDALWSLDLDPVDAPNLERGGHSEVSRVTLDAQGLPSRTFFVKRQTNHLGRSLQRPLGEPTFAREARNVATFHRLNIPALETAYFEERKNAGRWQAILITPELEGYADMIDIHSGWPDTPEPTRARIIDSCGELLRTLHKRRWRHGSLYAKHVFLRADDAALHGFDARFIDLEKSRPLLLAGKEKRRDLQIFARRLTQWQAEEWRRLLSIYLEQPMESRQVGRWMRALKLSEA